MAKNRLGKTEDADFEVLKCFQFKYASNKLPIIAMPDARNVPCENWELHIIFKVLSKYGPKSKITIYILPCAGPAAVHQHVSHRVSAGNNFNSSSRRRPQRAQSAQPASSKPTTKQTIIKQTNKQPAALPHVHIQSALIEIDE
jgi:hypothetical protein